MCTSQNNPFYDGFIQVKYVCMFPLKLNAKVTIRMSMSESLRVRIPAC